MSTPPHPQPPPPILPHSDALLTLSRHQSHLQSHLQTLLDAQSSGLLAGLTGTSSIPDDESSAGSRTPTTIVGSTARLPRSPNRVVPVRQPVAKKVGLRGARRGIARTMGELARLKGEEGRVLEDEAGKREEVLATVEGFERKATGLRERIRGIEGEEEARRVEGLTKEEEGLGKEIHEMETRLFEMKARHRHLVREIEGVSNAVQSKLSSYESALQLAERDVWRFLERPPLEGGMRGKGEGVWALPRERRTLEMVGEFYGEEIGGLRGALEGVEKEARALEEGGVVWGAVVGLVDDVEKGLREEMQRMQRPLVEMGEEGGAVAGMRGILQTMRKARLRIEERLEQAERNDWKLLVCCIGAELEALIEGQAVLEGALEAAQGGAMSRDEHGGESSSQENGVGVAEQQLVDDSVPASSSQDAPSPAQGFLDRSEDEDDGPGPELLISQHDE